jgi:hypothetical protein
MSDENPVVPTWPPPKAAAVDPFGMQTGSTASTAVGTVLVAASGAGNTIASALGLGTSAKVATAGLSLAAIGHESLFCAGLGMLGLGIVLNVASLVVRRQLLQEYENEYIKARDVQAELARKQASPPPPPPEPPAPRY